MSSSFITVTKRVRVRTSVIVLNSTVNTVLTNNILEVIYYLILSHTTKGLFVYSKLKFSTKILGSNRSPMNANVGPAVCLNGTGVSRSLKSESYSRSL